MSLSSERSVRLLRAKAAELEFAVKHLWLSDTQPPPTPEVVQEAIGNLTADIALVAGLLADHIEQSPGPWGPEDENWGEEEYQKTLRRYGIDPEGHHE